MGVFYLYAIGAGWNVAQGSLTNFESLTCSGESALKVGGMYGTYDPGLVKIRGDGSLYSAGYGSCALPMPGIARAWVRCLMVTYCASGYSGKVTIYVRTDDPATYSRQNAYMVLPKLSEVQKRATAFQDYVIRFTRLVTSV
jgi:hypothetical protein